MIHNNAAVMIGKYIFDPQEDITAYELSIVTSTMARHLVNALTDEQILEVLLEYDLTRHFREYRGGDNETAPEVE